MGLDCSHDAFHGAYSAFNRLRQFVCAATGPDGSYPPHYQYTADGGLQDGPNGLLLRRTDLDDNMFYIGDEYGQESHPGLWEFLTHSDCDGEIAPEMCVKVADDLERLLPKMEAMTWASHGHIAARGGFLEVVRKFIAGCRAAAAANEPLAFH
jgi:hypothetical protein